ncbi:MAG: c-type cytochrome [Halofilum sp. (in: g-proteobacteria)]|nr:c-type cytochrome [Halofilum sp. (in: g-proteobacteria)]
MAEHRRPARRLPVRAAAGLQARRAAQQRADGRYGRWPRRGGHARPRRLLQRSSRSRRSWAPNDEDLVERGRRIYLGGIPSKGVAACVACHGPRGKGNPAADYPVVGGQWPQYLMQQLQHFRSGERANDPNAMMRSLASEMTDAEIRAVSEYMAGLN